MKRYRRVTGCVSRRLRDSWEGASSHPRGKARPVRKKWTGKRSAATVPPALNKSHKSGVIRSTIYPRSSTKATAPESTSQAA